MVSRRLFHRLLLLATAFPNWVQALQGACLDPDALHANSPLERKLASLLPDQVDSTRNLFNKLWATFNFEDGGGQIGNLYLLFGKAGRVVAKALMEDSNGLCLDATSLNATTIQKDAELTALTQRCKGKFLVVVEHLEALRDCHEFRHVNALLPAIDGTSAGGKANGGRYLLLFEEEIQQHDGKEALKDRFHDCNDPAVNLHAFLGRCSQVYFPPLRKEVATQEKSPICAPQPPAVPYMSYIIALVVGASLAGGAYYLTQNSKRQDDDTPSRPPTAKPSHPPAAPPSPTPSLSRLAAQTPPLSPALSARGGGTPLSPSTSSRGRGSPDSYASGVRKSRRIQAQHEAKGGSTARRSRDG